MRGQVAGLAAFGAMVACAPEAHAQVSEVYGSVVQHNVCVTDCKNSNKEDGPNVDFQVSFSSPGALHWLGSPQPYVMGSLNTAGETSFSGVGLEWRWQFSHHLSFQPGFGYVIHNGEVNNKFANGTPEAAEFAREHVLLGSRDLFRTSFGLTYSSDSSPWEAGLIYEHLSHGQILGHGRNQGLDEVGVRVGYRFGDH